MEFKELTPKKKLEHIWEYYKIHIISLIAIIGVIIWGVNHFILHPEPTVCCGVAVYGNRVTLNSLELLMSLNNDEEDPENDPFNAEAFWQMLDQSWYNNHKETGTGMPRPKEVIEYFANKYDTKVESFVSSSAVDNGPQPTGRHIYTLTVTFSDNKKTKYHIVSRGHEIVVRENDGNGNIVTNPCIPEGCQPGTASPSPSASELPDEVKENLLLFGNVCYGDQSFDGIVYAKENFTADLKDRFTLTLRGAVRVEKGNIDVTCKSAHLTYDETYFRLLLPNYFKLNRTMWNCW